MKRKLNQIKKLIYYIKKVVSNKSIIIVAPYFTKERLKDGYFKRVKAIDELLKDYYKVYVTYENKSLKLEYEEINENTLVVRYMYGSKMQKIFVYILMMFCGKIYCHSVWQAKKKFYLIPFAKIYVDLHGVVPEEESLYERYEDAQRYGDIEEVVVNKSEYLICVTEKIREHLVEKYGKKFKAKTIILPIFDTSLKDQDTLAPIIKPFINNRPVVIYAGGIMKWQKIELMQDSIFKQIDDFEFLICVPKPAEFWQTWNHSRKFENLKVTSKTYKELCNEVYVKAHYGYVLRDDIIVNNVACPTKIAEYLKYKIIPIVSSPNIGDFKKLGMKYITLEDFNEGKLYTIEEMESIINFNLSVLDKYIKVHEEGKKLFREIFK